MNTDTHLSKGKLSSVGGLSSAFARRKGLFYAFLTANALNAIEFFTPAISKLRVPIKGGTSMNIALLIIATGTAAYLFYALICPERLGDRHERYDRYLCLSGSA